MDRKTGSDRTVSTSKIRIAALVCIFFILANIIIAFGAGWYYRYHNKRVQFGYRLPNKFVLIRKELPSVINYIENNRGRYDVNVIMLGDSVSYGAGSGVKADENAGKYLEDQLKEALPGRKVRVWNLAMPGSKPGDTYYLYKRSLELNPDLIIISFNYIFYTPSNIKSSLAYNWIVPDIDPEGRYSSQVKDFLCPGAENAIKLLAIRHIPIYRYRDLINGLVFKDQPAKSLQFAASLAVAGIERVMTKGGNNGKTVDAKNPDTNTGNQWFNQDWSGRMQGMAWMYNITPIDTEKNVAYLFTREILDDIEAKGVPAVIFMAGQNHKLLAPLIDNEKYEANRQKLNLIFEGRDFSYIDFDNKIDDFYFVDNVHLTAEGNKLLALRLKDLALKELKDTGARGE